MRLKINVLKFSLAIASLLTISTASASTHELIDCAQLQAPKTVLLVHVSNCPHCRNFLPIYNEVSNLAQMKDYTFYTKEISDVDSVCNKKIYGVPVTFSHNMEKSLLGSTSKKELIRFVKSS